jgi:hypothetical protein
MCESLHVILRNKHDINENTIKIPPTTNSNSSFNSISSSSSTSLSSKRKAPLGLNKWELSVSDNSENKKKKIFNFSKIQRSANEYSYYYILKLVVHHFINPLIEQ